LPAKIPEDGANFGVRQYDRQTPRRFRPHNTANSRWDRRTWQF
jgi:hypothetical protein